MSDDTKQTIEEEAAERPTRTCATCGHTTTKEENRFCVWAERVLDELGKVPGLVTQDGSFGLQKALRALEAYGAWWQACPSDIESLYKQRMWEARNIVEFTIRERWKKNKDQ